MQGESLVLTAPVWSEATLCICQHVGEAVNICEKETFIEAASCAGEGDGRYMAMSASLPFFFQMGTTIAALQTVGIVSLT